MATKSKIFDPTFSLSSELLLINYITKEQSTTTIEQKFCSLLWCEVSGKSFLVAGQENGVVSIYALKSKEDTCTEFLELVKSKKFLNDDVIVLDYLHSKHMLVAGSSKEKIIFWQLDNLEKEYSLEVVIEDLSCISWNTKVSKILAVGTSTGFVKLIDIKKNQIIMDLNNNEFKSVKKMMWSDNTKLVVQSEMSYLIEFDLTNDAKRVISNNEDLNSTIQNLPASLLTFNKHCMAFNSFIDLFDSHNHCLEMISSRHFINESTDCVLSNINSMAAISLKNGNTELIRIPKSIYRIPICRQQNKIFNFKHIFELKEIDVSSTEKSVNKSQPNSDGKQPSADDDFYNLVRGSLNNSSELVKILLDNSDKINPSYASDESINGIAIDISDKNIKSLISGDFSTLTLFDTTLPLLYLAHIINHDSSVLETISDFPTLFALSKIFNNYQFLSKVDNSRILAAILLLNNLDLEILNRDKEGRILNGILTGNYSRYINNRIMIGEDFYKNIQQIETVLLRKECGDGESVAATKLISDNIKSDYLVDYFWYKVSTGKFDEVKYLVTAEEDIQFYISGQVSANNTNGVVTELRNINIKENMQLNKPISPNKPIGINNISNLSRSVGDINHTSVGAINQPVLGSISQPSRPNNVAPTRQINGIIQPGLKNSNLPGPSNIPQQNTSNPNIPNHFNRPLMNNEKSMTNIQPINNSRQPIQNSGGITMNQSSNVIPTRSTISQPPKSPFMGSVPSRPNPINSMNNTGNNGVNNTIPTPPKSPFMGSAPQRPGIPINFPKSPNIGNNRAIPQAGGTPQQHSQNNLLNPINQPSRNFNQQTGNINKPPISNIRPPQINNSTTIQNNSGANLDSSAILRNFINLIHTVKSKVANKNSMLINQKKQRYLNALSTFDSVDQNSIPIELLQTMEFICKRVMVVDESMKSDLDLIISDECQVIWIKAIVELIRIGY